MQLAYPALPPLPTRTLLNPATVPPLRVEYLQAPAPQACAPAARAACIH